MAGNIFATGMDAFKDGFDATQGVQDQRTRVQAGRRLAAGDRRGAAEVYGAGGMGDQVRTLQADQQSEDRQVQSDEIAAKQRNFATLKQVSEGLKLLPEEARYAELQRIAPVFQAIGIGADVLAQIKPADLSDAGLATFGADLEDQWQSINLGAGGVGTYNKRTNEYRTLREPDPKLVAVPNGGTLFDPANNQPVYVSKKTFAPQRSGGGAPKRSAQQMTDAELLAIVQGGSR